ncbi:MAG: patatin-like phospholipase family protein [Pseudomonadaceae bacterium]|nr:patatin-like phospholipase family protein [Pseudomonadaceae bacterium]
MKGGLTSGVVYPKTIIELSQAYEFKQVGGASAGAIAAAFAAAAEMNRAGQGFERLAELPNELGAGLEDLFQPYPIYRRIFKKVLKRLAENKSFGVGFVIWNFIAIRKLLKNIDETHFGICPGTTQVQANSPGLTQWLNTRLEYVSGRIDHFDETLPAVPLTFGMLGQAGVQLKLITTNLTRHRPETLPLRRGFRLKEDDLNTFLPRNVADHIRLDPTSEDASLYKVPAGEDMPVLLAVRMSLAFPLLFSAVPLYAIDYSLVVDTPRCKEQAERPQLNLFSDGGISSNFPIHYFDAMFPTRPTFGINLTAHHPCRHGQDTSSGPLWNRIYMPFKPGGGLSHGASTINSLGGFLFSIINSAKDWQDALQSRMPGYRERIVHIALKDEEGGANLSMPSETIDALTELGELAAVRILSGHGTNSENEPAFSFKVHQWRRLLSVMAALEDELPRLIGAYSDPNLFSDPSDVPVSDLINELIVGITDAEWQALGYKPPTPDELTKLKARLDALVLLSRTWAEQSRDPSWNMPSPAASLAMKSIQV